jgi:hypothetical protein
MVLREEDEHGPETPPTTAAKNEPAANADEHTAPADLHRVLTEIRDLLDRNVRRRRQEDFSLVRLCGALLQMLAVAAALWGLPGLFGGDPAAAAARFTLAAFLQLASLAILLGQRRD